MKTIDITPTWGEWMNIYRTLAESGERQAIRHLAQDAASAAAAAEALRALMNSKTLTDQQMDIVGRTLKDELTKQGY